MDKYIEAVKRIVQEQQLIVGPVAVDLAKRVRGLNMENSTQVTIIGDPKEALNNLVMQYENLFGNVSVQVSKKALKSANLTFSSEELPSVLR